MVKAAAVEGVPEMTPVPALSVNGAERPVADHTYGASPPIAARVALYGDPAEAGASAAVEIASGCGAAVTVTAVVTSGMLTPLALIVVVPTATDVTGIRIPGAVLPSQIKMPVGCIVA